MWKPRANQAAWFAVKQTRSPGILATPWASWSRKASSTGSSTAQEPTSSTPESTSPAEIQSTSRPRLPRNVQAVYLKPLKRQAKYGIPTCDLQLRSYNVRSVEFYADFALRAAYYLGLPASGPVPLPRIVERWTVPRSVFVHKSSQENFERRTVRRLIQIKDGHPETVDKWLGFLRKHAYPGVGMKANKWTHESLEPAKAMDGLTSKDQQSLEKIWENYGTGKMIDQSENKPSS